MRVFPHAVFFYADVEPIAVSRRDFSAMMLKLFFEKSK